MWLPNAADALSGMGLLPASSDVLLVDMASYRPPDELRMVMSEVKNVGRTWKVSVRGQPQLTQCTRLSTAAL